jgi:RNA recognition motif-containing protein
VTVLEQAQQWERLETALQEFAEVFPLPEPQWVSWLGRRVAHLRQQIVQTTQSASALSDDDAQRLDTQATQLVELFWRAVGRDCPSSTPLWLAFAEAVQLLSLLDSEVCTRLGGFEYVRGVFENAIRFTGHNCVSGGTVWLAYIEWEQELLTGLEAAGSMSNVVEQQIERIRKVYSRALAAPLSDGAAVWEDYVDWEKDEKKKSGLQKRYDIGQKAYEVRKAHEERVESLGKPLHEQQLENQQSLYQNFCDYLSFEEHQLSGKKEKGKRDPSSGVSLFERGLATFASSAEVWLRYLSFLHKWCGPKKQGDDGGDGDEYNALLNVAERASRACTWNGSLLATCARICFLYSTSEEDRAEIGQFLVASLSGSLSSADDYHAIYSAIEDLFPEQDAFYEKHSEVLTSTFADRRDLLGAYHTHLANVALSTKQLDEYMSQSELALKAYGNGAWTAWQQFLSGMTTFLVASDDNAALEERIRSLFKRAANSVTDAPESAFQAWLNWERVWGTPSSVIEATMMIERRTRTVNAMRMEWQKKHEREAAAAAPQAASAAPVSSTTTAAPAPTSSDETGSKERTVFVKNLVYEVTEDQVKEAFSPFGTIVSVRLPRDAAGMGKGFAFVEYENAQQAIAALVMNGKEVLGRPVMVSKSVSSVGDTGVAPVTTLYVFNLPYDCTEADVKNALSAAITVPIRAVRILKTAEGQGKGGAFVDFVQNIPLSIVSLDGTLRVKGRLMRIEVAKNKTGARKEKEKEEARNNNNNEEGGGDAEQGGRKHADAPKRDDHVDVGEPSHKRVKDNAGHAVEQEAPHESYDDSKTVFVDSVPASANDEHLKLLFAEKCGPVSGVRLMMRPDGSHRGRAYVDFETKESRDKALQLNGEITFEGTVLRCLEPKPREKGKSLKVREKDVVAVCWRFLIFVFFSFSGSHRSSSSSKGRFYNELGAPSDQEAATTKERIKFLFFFYLFICSCTFCTQKEQQDHEKAKDMQPLSPNNRPPLLIPFFFPSHLQQPPSFLTGATTESPLRSSPERTSAPFGAASPPPFSALSINRALMSFASEMKASSTFLLLFAEASKNLIPYSSARALPKTNTKKTDMRLQMSLQYFSYLLLRQ